jgi:flagellar hook-associated protein 2
MGSIGGIDISSLLSALGSSSSGINVASAVASAMQAISLPELEWEQEEVTLQSNTAGINGIQSDVGTLQTALQAMADPAGAIASMTASSSDSNLVTATAAPGTPAGSHVVVVNSVATTSSWYSDAVATSSTALPAGSFTLQVGTGTPTTIAIGGSTDTLDELATSINTQSLGVTASVINDSSGSRLAIVSQSSGSANGITISAASGLTFTQASAGTDASLTVDGIPIDSASNTVSGAIPGLTLNLVGAAPTEQVNVNVAPDSDQATKAINAFVTAYNTAVGDVNTQFTVNANNQEGPLAGDSTVQMLQSSLLSVAGYSGGGNGVSTLADLGISMNKDGTLSVDSAQLGNAIQNNFAAVQGFMQGTASNGFASFLNTALDSLTAPTTGAFSVDLQSMSSQNSDLQTQINNFQTYLGTQQKLLTAEYNNADIALQKIPEEEAQLNAELGYPPDTKS